MESTHNNISVRSVVVADDDDADDDFVSPE